MHQNNGALRCSGAWCTPPWTGGPTLPLLGKLVLCSGHPYLSSQGNATTKVSLGLHFVGIGSAMHINSPNTRPECT